VNSLADLREALKHPLNGFQVIDTMPGEGRGRLVFKAGDLETINARVRDRYGIPGPLPVTGVAVRPMTDGAEGE
jgi:hypothetical protein